MMTGWRTRTVVLNLRFEKANAKLEGDENRLDVVQAKSATFKQS